MTATNKVEYPSSGVKEESASQQQDKIDFFGLSRAHYHKRTFIASSSKNVHTWLVHRGMNDCELMIFLPPPPPPPPTSPLHKRYLHGWGQRSMITTISCSHRAPFLTQRSSGGQWTTEDVISCASLLLLFYYLSKERRRRCYEYALSGKELTPSRRQG